MRVGSAPRSKLFRAIVGLGLAAAGCGGKDLQGTVDGGQSAQMDGAAKDTGGYFSADDTGAPIFGSPDGSMDLDAAAAADVASDVASEVWRPVPIQ